MICRFCEKEFTQQEVENGTPLPTTRHQHYRLVSIDEVVHKFDPRKKSKKDNRIFQEQN